MKKTLRDILATRREEAVNSELWFIATNSKYKDDLEFLERLYKDFSPYADSQFPMEIVGKESFHNRYFEMYLGSVFLAEGFPLTTISQRTTEGPDLCIAEDAGRVWVEATCSSSGGKGPNHVQDISEKCLSNKFISFTPDVEGIILRMRNSLEEKHEKYLEYLRKKTVQANERYVIAINTGKITQCVGDDYPEYILQAIFPIGEQECVINPQTSDIIESRFSYRPFVTKKTQDGTQGAKVTTNIFASDTYSGISGIIYSRRDVFNRTDQLGSDFIFVHNPWARLPIQLGWLKVGKEYWIENGNIKSKTWNR